MRSGDDEEEDELIMEDSAVLLGHTEEQAPPTPEQIQASPTLMAAVVRELERRALSETIAFMENDLEALDLKEYYQERRLKDLGLDTELDNSDNPDVGWGQSRGSAGADLDW